VRPAQTLVHVKPEVDHDNRCKEPNEVKDTVNCFRWDITD
jgi:hypothetical protein